MVMSESMAGSASKGLTKEKKLGDQGINASQLAATLIRGRKNATRCTRDLVSTDHHHAVAFKSFPEIGTSFCSPSNNPQLIGSLTSALVYIWQLVHVHASVTSALRSVTALIEADAI